MNLDEMKNTWVQQESQNAAAITIDQRTLVEMKINKQMQQLRAMKWARIIESVLFFCILILLGQYIAQGEFTLSATKVSALILSVFAIIGLAGNIGQVILIAKVDYSQPINELQKNIYQVCCHKLQLTKLLLMSTPFYLAYVFIGFDVLFGIALFQHLESHMVWFYSVSSVLLLIVTVWLSAKLNYKNIHTDWVKNTIQFIVGERLVNVAQFINNIESS
ncbi:hypothetical protein DS2_16709 [Catenovulum agarivorans DS-2]|uniref:Uncharacterized protein n=1 Tax=Catenovulum agarivorans DS-2 TaxID=1328313 RepID=W7Q9H9_9ALTE|nr:hypothetical protein [Catenovulum agarivorans]EWH08606.1 hypothetical protein DS2_16709 [Catenovulum agarivorans DS-2]